MASSFLSRFLGNSAGLGGALIQRLGIAISDDYSDESTHPTISAGSGAPSATEPNGSLYLRTSGLIYRRVGSAWEQIIGAAGALVGDTVSELTGGAGVTVDGVLLKDATVDVNGTADAVILDADADTTISSPTDDQIDFEVGGSDVAVLTASSLALAANVTLDLQGGADALVLDADNDTTISSPTDDQIDVEIAGADDFTFTANLFTALSGSSIATNTIVETTAASGVTVDGVLLKDGGIVCADAATIEVDTVNEATAAAGVTIDGVLLKDGVNRGTLYASNVFLSSEQTGNGSEQDVAHGLGATPALVFAVASNLTGGAYVVTYGTHDATNAKVTVTSGEKYRVVAFK